MRVAIACGLLVLVTGCGSSASPGAPAKPSGRFAGIGTFDAGRLWAELADIEAPADQAAATVADDEHIIVVIDTHTGEIRQCGDHSGHCVTTNPWRSNQASRSLPVRLRKHAADLAASDEAGASVENVVAPAQ